MLGYLAEGTQGAECSCTLQLEVASESCKTNPDNLHALQYIVLRYGIPLAVNHVQTSASAALRSLICSAQPYSTAPYSHGTLGAWPRPQNLSSCAAAASASQPTTIQCSPFPVTSHNWTNCTQKVHQRVTCKTVVLNCSMPVLWKPLCNHLFILNKQVMEMHCN